MLEILFIAYLCGSIGKQCRKKYVKPLPYQIMLVVLWVGGEIAGFVMAEVMRSGEMGMGYVLALCGAAAGAGLTFLIVNLIPANAAPPSARSAVVIGLPTAARSDQEAQPLVRMAQDCEARQDWVQALNYWRQVMDKAADPQWIEFARQRGQQLHQWLSQQQVGFPQRPAY